MIFQKGTYYIGDPTFIIPNQKTEYIWGTILQKSQVFIDYLIYNGYKFICGNTGGPGMYRDQFDNIYGIDSGCLSVMPIKMVQSIINDNEYFKNLVEYSTNNQNKLTLIKTFENDFEILYSNGSFKIDSHVINT